MKIHRKKRNELSLNIAPLIDIVFLLLIFFMVATSFDERAGFKLELPKSSIKKEANTDNTVRIVVENNKDIYLVRDNKSLKLDREDLSKSLKNILQENSDVNFLVSADKNIEYGFIVELMSDIKDAGATAINVDTTLKR